MARGSAGGRPPLFDKEIYKNRNVVERAINRLRGYRAVATRCDKREFVYKGTIDVASIVIWRRDPTGTDPRDTPQPRLNRPGNHAVFLVATSRDGEPVVEA